MTLAEVLAAITGLVADGRLSADVGAKASASVPAMLDRPSYCDRPMVARSVGVEMFGRSPRLVIVVGCDRRAWPACTDCPCTVSWPL